MGKLFFIIMIICLAMVQAPVFAHHLEAQKEHSRLILISPALHNFLFKSILDRLMVDAGFEYVPSTRPTRRALQEMKDGQLDLAGPYPQSVLPLSMMKNDHAEKPLSGIRLIEWGPIAFYPMTLENRFSFTHMHDIQNLKVGYLFNQFEPHFEGHPFNVRAKNMDQLIALLETGRIDVALLSGRKSLEAQRLYPELDLHIGTLPLQQERQFLLIQARDSHFSNHIEKALSALRQTQFFKVRQERYGENLLDKTPLFFSGPPTSSMR